jgi:hypothetical protein
MEGKRQIPVKVGREPEREAPYLEHEAAVRYGWASGNCYPKPVKSNLYIKLNHDFLIKGCIT